MDRQVEGAIQNCSVCQSADKKAKTTVAPLQPVPLPDRPWQKLAIDIVGPIEKAPQECRYAITLVDYFSKWPEVKFSREVTTRSVTNFLLQVFSREGYPDEVVADNGSQFSSREVARFFKEREIRLTHSSVYYPQANGQVERFNRVFKNFIQLALLEHRTLQEAVTDYLGVYRCTPHATTGVAPALLLHGRLPRTRLDIVGHPSPSFFTDPIEELRQLRYRVRQKQAYSKIYTDRRRAAKNTDIGVGDRVRVRKPTVGFKGDLSFSHPRRVMEQKGPSTFSLDDGNTWNASKMAKMPPQHVQTENPPSARSDTGHSATPSLLSDTSDTGHTATPPRTPAQASAIDHCSGSTTPGVTARTMPVGGEHSSAVTLQQVPGQEEVQATSGSPYEPPARRVQPPRARRPPNRYLDYV